MPCVENHFLLTSNFCPHCGDNLSSSFDSDLLLDRPIPIKENDKFVICLISQEDVESLRKVEAGDISTIRYPNHVIFLKQTNSTLRTLLKSLTCDNQRKGKVFVFRVLETLSTPIENIRYTYSLQAQALENYLEKNINKTQKIYFERVFLHYEFCLKSEKEILELNKPEFTLLHLTLEDLYVPSFRIHDCQLYSIRPDIQPSYYRDHIRPLKMAFTQLIADFQPQANPQEFILKMLGLISINEPSPTPTPDNSQISDEAKQENPV